MPLRIPDLQPANPLHTVRSSSSSASGTHAVTIRPSARSALCHCGCERFGEAPSLAKRHEEPSRYSDERGCELHRTAHPPASGGAVACCTAEEFLSRVSRLTQSQESGPPRHRPQVSLCERGIRDET